MGDAVAVGNIVGSFGTCDMCRVEHENFCREFPTLTYGGRDRRDGTTTDGAYAGEYVVRDRFVYHCPENLDPAGVAPLMLVDRKSLSSAGSGGHRYTQELLDFCGRHGITADVEVVLSAQVNAALDRLARNDVRYRFTLDLSDV